MGLLWDIVARPAFRLVDSERAHTLAIKSLSRLGEKPSGQYLLNSLYKAPNLPIEVFGQLFHHPLGLAAGFDKGAEALLSWSSMGFSWTEYGGITRFPQDGNPKPRMFRANKERALVNRMGFNNPGATDIAERLLSRRVSGKWPKSPVAANIGRSKKTPNLHAADDYSATLEMLWDHADIFVLNFSSPNTIGLRDLLEEQYMENILSACISVKNKKQVSKPLLLKLSPDSEDDMIRQIVGTSISMGIDGIVATNTTIKRPFPKSTQSRKTFANDGGLSGRPLHQRSIEVIDLIYAESQGKIPIVGVGGIDSAETAWTAITSGASLIQLYSALVFHGPSVVYRIIKGLKNKLIEHNLSEISEAVGYKHI